jgi:hypothetical protein
MTSINYWLDYHCGNTVQRSLLDCSFVVFVYGYQRSEENIASIFNSVEKGHTFTKIVVTTTTK